MCYDVEEIRRHFPGLQRSIGRYPLVYLDNTATSQTPQCVVDALDDVYLNHKANVHRGVHTLSQEATELQEGARRSIAAYIGAAEPAEVIMTRGTTEALNLVVQSYGGSTLQAGDEVIVTVMEHHANIVPWQLLQQRIPFTLRAIPILADGSLDMEAYRKMLSPRTKIVSVCHASNVLGTVNPIAEIAALAHDAGALMVVDGAQGAAHLKVDVKALGADFYAFSLHKMYGPAGVGVLYGRRTLLERMPPWQGGGEMIATVRLDAPPTFAELPYRFEAGTPDFPGIAASAAALRFIETLGLERAERHEQALYRQALEETADLPLDIYGTAAGKCAILSFNLRGAHAYDVGTLLDKQGVAVRTGHHCAQPLMLALGIEGCVRASFAPYNTAEEVTRLAAALRRAAAMLL